MSKGITDNTGAPNTCDIRVSTRLLKIEVHYSLCHLARFDTDGWVLTYSAVYRQAGIGRGVCTRWPKGSGVGSTLSVRSGAAFLTYPSTSSVTSMLSARGWHGSDAFAWLGAYCERLVAVPGHLASPPGIVGGNRRELKHRKCQDGVNHQQPPLAEFISAATYAHSVTSDSLDVPRQVARMKHAATATSNIYLHFSSRAFGQQ